jgi:diguanylate cyclase (GGDEF)-like protein/PAS domain S-box-containing protein
VNRRPPRGSRGSRSAPLKEAATHADNRGMGSCTRVVRTVQALMLDGALVLLRALQAVLAASLRTLADLQRRAEVRRSATVLLAERASLHSNSWKAAFEAAPIGIARVNLEGRIEEANPSLCALLGEPRAALAGRRLSALVHPDDLALLDGPGHPGKAGRGPARAELRLISAGGNLRWCELSSVLVRDPQGRPEHVLVHVVDITRHKRSQAQLRDLATRDPLTGLANRRWFELQLGRHVRACLEDGPKGAVLVIDLDDFKTVNDTLGHQAGDRLVVEAAHTLRRHLRDQDLLARLGGDEFAVLLRDGGSRAAESVARKLVIAARDEIALAEVSGPDAVGPPDGLAAGDDPPSVRVTVSVGVAAFEALAGRGPKEVVKAADTSMYAVKRSGRNGYAVYGAPDGPRHARPLRRQPGRGSPALDARRPRRLSTVA